MISLRKKFKRVPLFIMPIIIISMLFIESCDKSAATITEKIVKPKPLKGRLVIWCSKDDASILKQLSSEFEKKNIQVKIDISVVKDKEVQQKYVKLKNASQNDKVPDLLEVETENVPYLLHEMPKEFQTVNLPGGILNWKDSEISIEGKNYAIPWNTDSKVMLYNKDVLKKNNVDAFNIKTWNDFIVEGEKISKQGITMLAGYNNDSNDVFQIMCRELNFNVYNEDGEIEIDEEKLGRVLKQVKDLYVNKLYTKKKNISSAMQTLRSGKAAAMIADSRVLNEINNNSTKYKGANWDIERLPAFEPGGKNSACGSGKAFMRTNTKNSVADTYIKFILEDKIANIELLQNKAYITANSNIYKTSYFNSKVPQFDNKKLWRFMAEISQEEKPAIYGDGYGNIMRKLKNVQKKVMKAVKA